MTPSQAEALETFRKACTLAVLTCNNQERGAYARYQERNTTARYARGHIDAQAFATYAVEAQAFIDNYWVTIEAAANECAEAMQQTEGSK